MACNDKCEQSFLALAEKKIFIQEFTETIDAVGAPQRSWQDLKSVWAALKPTSGYERLKYEQLQAVVTHKITMRYVAVLTPPNIGAKYRLRYGTRYFNIRSVINLDEKNRFLELMAEEGVAT